MKITKYEELIEKTSIYPEKLGILYPTLGLVGEAGEVAEKVKKLVRDKNYLTINADGSVVLKISEQDNQELIKELGDVIWYVAAIARDHLGVTLGHVMQVNYDKLSSRLERNKLDGEGDNR